MPARELLEQIKHLSPPEKEELLSHLFDHEEYWMMLGRFAPFFRWQRPPGFLIGEYPGIVTTPDVCGGSARVIRTRIPVWALERMRQLGVSEANLLQSYPSLRAVDLVQAWAYAAAHRDAIEKDIRENEAEDEPPVAQPSAHRKPTRKPPRKGK